MRCPSVKTLLQIKDVTPEDATQIRSIMRKYHFTNALRRIDAILQTCGVEHLIHRNNRLCVSYCNNGDSYAPTVCYNLETGSYSVKGWADWVEANPNKYP